MRNEEWRDALPPCPGEHFIQQFGNHLREGVHRHLRPNPGGRLLLTIFQLRFGDLQAR
jgi:hypothetical protein